MKRILLASLTLAPFFMAPQTQAETIDGALVAAHRNNPNLEEARLALRAARQDRVQARAAYLPQLGVSASHGAQHVESDTIGLFGPQTTERHLAQTNTSAQLTQNVLTGGRRDGQSRLARASVDNANQALRGTAQDVLLAAAETYLSVLRDQEVVRLREEHVSGLTRQLNGVRRRLEVGEVSRTDVAQTQTRLSGAQANLARARADLETSRARYEAIVGAPPEDLTPVAAPPEGPHSLDEAVRQAELGHPDLMRARSNERAARARVTIERSALLPQVSIVGRADESREPGISEPYRESESAVAQFSMPLFEGGYAWSRTRQARINVDRAEAVTEAQRRDVVANVTSAWSDLEAGRSIVDAAREQVAAATAAVEGTERERGLGMRSTLDVLDAEEEARNAQINLTRAEADAIFAAYALMAASGTLTLQSATEGGE